MIASPRFIYQNPSIRIYKSENQEIIKVLRTDAPNYAMALLSLQNEYDLSHDFHFDGIRKALYLGTFDQSPALFLDYVEGISLKAFTKKFTWIEGVELGIELAKRLHLLHQKNIIHKDINPNNIIIHPESLKITLIDFGISSRVSQKQYHLGNPKHLEGTLKYISPEQTGRVNKVVDYRTDLYSLGIILYELLTGNVPFDFNDPMELVYAHIATVPQPIHQINTKIPNIFSDIVAKLLKKNAENRYQTAWRLKHDLQSCLMQFKENQTIINFKLGKKDYSGKLQLPQKLYGREAEIQTLLNAFERTSQGNKELVLVGGYSGVGKSVLVNEIHKPITEKRAYFIGGKFDQYQRNIPYFALRKAFAELINYWLSEENEVIEKWKIRIQKALGELAKVVTEIIPELELLIGQPVEVPLLEGEQYANRFNYVFGLFMSTICSEENPLIIFIDDWQWADRASLNLFKVLLADENLKNVLFIGAYRDNEVDESHPFIHTLESIEKAQVTPIKYLTLQNLSKEDVSNWVSDVLQASSTYTQELVELVYSKTQGNAFFTGQFLQNLVEEKLLYFDFEQGCWQWQIKDIKAQNITDNVVDLMAGKIQKLDFQTQKLLKIGACVGASFELKLIATVSEKSEEDCRKHLEPALIEGVLLKASRTTYQFVHDRIQQATYGLLSKIDQKKLHYTIGNIWLTDISEEEKETKLIDIVSQLNFGLELMKTSEEKQNLLTINIEAGQKAKNSIAYASAYNYFSVANSLLPIDAWEKQYEATFHLYKDWGKVALLVNEREESVELLETALQKAKDKYDKVKIHLLRMRQTNSEGKYTESNNEGIAALNLFGYNLPPITDQEYYTKAGNEELTKYLETIQKEIPLTEIENLPLMTEKSDLTCIQIMDMMFDGIFMSAPYAYLYILVKSMNFSFDKGQSGYLPAILATMGVVHSSIKDYTSTVLLSKIALALRDKFQLQAVDARFYHLLAFISIGNDLSYKFKFFYKAYQIGSETGDLSYAGYAILNAPLCKGLSSLKEMQKVLLITERFYKRYSPELLSVAHVYQGYVRSFEGKTEHHTSFSHTNFDEQGFVNRFSIEGIPFLMVYRSYKIRNLVIWHNYNLAYELVKMRNQVISVVGHLDAEIKGAFYFYSIITTVALFLQNKLAKKETKAVLEECLSEIELLNTTNPSLFGGIYYLALAQKAQFQNDGIEAMHQYDKGIESASENNLTMYVAIGNELAMQFYLSISKPQIAQIYLLQAVNSYQVWGATAKAKDLKIKYATLYQKAIPSHTTTQEITYQPFSPDDTYFITTNGQNLDINTLVKASQTLSKEIKLESLLQKMLRILIENAGADKGILLLSENDEWFIQGEIYANGKPKVLQHVSRADAPNLLADTVLNYVINTQKLFMVEEAQTDIRLANSPYLKHYPTKSILCLPILNQNKLTGILYLENSVIVGAFSKEGVQLLTALASQIAISIENALLYENLEEKVAKRTLKLQKQRDVLKTQKKEIENQAITLNHQAQALEELNQTKDQFFAIIAHDLRSPIAAFESISNQLDFYLEKQRPEKIKLLSEHIAVSSKNLNNLLNNLLSWALIQKKLIDSKPELIELDSIVKEVRLIYDHTFELYRITFSAEIPSEIKIYMDKNHLKTILRNLISNALKFTPKEKQINISARQQANKVQITIQDTGIGMDKEKLRNILKLHAVKSQKDLQGNKGTGLGLILVAEFVALNEGTLEIQSEVGLGTTIHLSFPSVIPRL